MLLFQKRFHAGLLDGAITLTFRRWKKPLVKPGGRYRCHPIGVLEVDAIERVTVAAITEEDSQKTGLANRAELLTYLSEIGEPLTDATELFRVTLHHGGDGDRIKLAEDADLSAGELLELRERLGKLDKDDPWTEETLRLIERFPRVSASTLAGKWSALKPHSADPPIGTPAFKARVVKLKKLGLTQSFEVGYELSPRGLATYDYQLSDSLWLRPAAGHTPGSTVVWLDAGVPAVFVGDLTHCPIQIPRPGDACAFDVDAEQAAVTRKRIFTEASRRRAAVVPAHYPGAGGATLVARGDRFEVDDWLDLPPI